MLKDLITRSTLASGIRRPRPSPPRGFYLCRWL